MDDADRLGPVAAEDQRTPTAADAVFYDWAATLCAGRRVAVVGSGESEDGAHVLAGVAASVGFVDAGEPETGPDVDAVVCRDLPGLFSDVEVALARLRLLAQRGALIVLGVPIPPGGAHDLDSARALADRIGPAELAWCLTAEGDAELFLAAVNAPEPLAPAARLVVAIAPVYHRVLRGLERANQELMRTNARLARDATARYDAAAGVTQAKLERALGEVEALRRERDEWHAESDRQAAAKHAAEEQASIAWHRYNELRERRAVRLALRVASRLKR